MTAAIKTTKQRRFSYSAPALWAVLIVAGVLFLYRYGEEVFREHGLNAQIAVQQRVNAEMRDENQRLQAALEYYLSDKYIEQRAREDLNLRRADEEVLIPIGNIGSAAQPQADASTAGATGTGDAAASEQKPNWQQWFELFGPFEASP